MGWQTLSFRADPSVPLCNSRLKAISVCFPRVPLTTNSPSLLGSEEFRERLDELRQTCDFVIIDAPPLTQHWDAIALSRLSDGVVLVLEADSTRLEAASAVTANLRSMKVSILAAVLNKHTFPMPEKIYSRL